MGVSVSQKASDKEHPYGHERMECVASIVLAVILAITGLGIGITGIEKIIGAKVYNDVLQGKKLPVLVSVHGVPGCMEIRSGINFIV